MTARKESEFLRTYTGNNSSIFLTKKVTLENHILNEPYMSSEPIYFGEKIVSEDA